MSTLAANRPVSSEGRPEQSRSVSRKSDARIRAAMQPAEKHISPGATTGGNTGEIDMMDVHHRTGQDELVQHTVTPPVRSPPRDRGWLIS